MNLLSNSQTDKEDLDKVTCKICLSIMIYPVTLPCHHELCRSCYDNNNTQANLACPFCRFRISTWARKSAKTNSIVNWDKWNYIRTKYCDLVEKEIKEKSDENDKIEFNFQHSDIGRDYHRDYHREYHREYHLEDKDIGRNYYQPGELYKEYQQQLQKVLGEKQVEEERDRKYVKKLLIDEENKQLKDDEKFAISLQCQELTRSNYRFRKRKSINYKENGPDIEIGD